MAIGTGTLIEFFGTQDDLASSSAAVANNAFSVTGDTADWTNDDDAPMASVTLVMDPASAPAGNVFVNLYAQYLNVVTTADGENPAATFPHKFMGAFPVSVTATVQNITIDIRLENWLTSSIYHFWIENKTGVSIDAGWALHITPKTIGPSA